MKLFGCFATKLSNGAILQRVDRDFYYFLGQCGGRVDDNTTLYPEALNQELHVTMNKMKIKSKSEIS